jgi:hypothetical protein
MERLGLVALPGGSWRAYAGPVALLAAATVAVGLLRGHMHGSHGGSSHPAVTRSQAPAPHRRALYVVRAGDTIDGIASRTRVPQARLLALNPKVSPTALFIGEKLRLR